MELAVFAEELQRYCMTLGGSVTSWGRTPAHNRAVGGVPNSRHLRWRAADVVYDEPVELHVANATAAAGGLLVLREGDHDHVYAP
jgi:Peptidase M15